MYLIIDIGGSKTRLEIFEEDKSILSLTIQGFGLPTDDAVQDLPELKLALQKINSNYFVSKVFINLGGKNKNQIHKVFSEVFQLSQINIFRESEGTVAKALAKKNGAASVLFAGTGSIVFGFDEYYNKLSISGGWGYLYSDKGSGFDIGRTALEFCVKELDSIDKLSMLTKKLTKQDNYIKPDLNGESICLLRDSIRENLGAMNRAQIAALVPSVVECARHNDILSLKVLKNAGYELGNLVANNRKKINSDNKRIVITGGLINFSQFWLESFCEVSDCALEDVIFDGNAIINGLLAISTKEGSIC